eukprot:CAMPEP_0205818356 /NCGR_PEP_ID=MMETSP0206-20130828/252_1 /ASSEMBLY_ACC=CAM_ASM_000279 /TAXON_ID=36767 /ORGANISM="Euplotes focardii, Strain TN1" /LENGTH=130 /DNA_ID=CAMNT_0053110665 /DNA_START=27 /DNA_END=419 /DNA_ORIENTATION=-
MTDSIDQKDLVLYSGCFCCNNSLYTDMPDCVGCSGKSEVCCIVEQFCLKKGAAPLMCEKADDEICQVGCYCLSIALKKPTTICKSQAQQCCFVGSAALPPDAEIPMTLAVCFLACFPSVGFFKTLGELTG